MKKAMMSSLLVAALSVAAVSARAADANVGVDLASAYVFRGATFNDGLVAQPYLNVEGLPVSLGVWANYDIDDYNGALADGQFSEVDFTVGYSLPIDSVVGIDLGYCEYLYPGAAAEADREISASAGLDVILAPSVTVAYGVDGGIDGSTYVEAGLGHEIEVEDLTLGLSAAVGYVEPDEGESGFSHYSVTASASYSFISASITYLDQIDDDVLADAYDVDVYGTLGVSYDF